MYSRTKKNHGRPFSSSIFLNYQKKMNLQPTIVYVKKIRKDISVFGYLFIYLFFCTTITNNAVHLVIEKKSVNYNC